MEQLIVIAVFSVCAAACVKILTSSYFTAKDTRDVSNAIIAAENGAECYKAKSGDMGKIAGVLGGSVGSVGSKPAVFVYYNADWSVCGEKEAAYMMRIVSDTQGMGKEILESGELSVDRINEHEATLICIPVAVAVDNRG